MADVGALRSQQLSAPGAGAPARRFDAEFGLNFVVAALLVLFLLPLLIALAGAVFLQDGGPVIFVQRRIGRNGRPFPCFKLRSMAVDAETRLQSLLANDPAARADWERDHKLKSDPRVTALGRFLRTSSLDELPQLFNIMRGEMSLVGPRPIVQAELSRYGRHSTTYCSVRPGITGLWQVSGRNDVSYRKRVAMDVLYARSKSLPLDLKIIALTIPAVLLKRGCY